MVPCSSLAESTRFDVQSEDIFKGFSHRKMNLFKAFKPAEDFHLIALCSLLLYGSYDLTSVENRIIIETKIDDTGQLDSAKAISRIKFNVLTAVISFFLNCLCFVLFPKLLLFRC